MDELDSRDREILKAIIQEHIATGEPVGSSAIARRDVAVSPATVRGVMADLEELGLLEKPHTSAGRVPTSRGYRYYVDVLVQIQPPSRSERELIEKSLAPAGAAGELLRGTTRLLSTLSHYAAVITTPATDQLAWRRLEFIRLKEDRVLAVLVHVSGLVRNRLLTLDFPLTDEELARAAGFLNELIADTPVEIVRERLRGEVERARHEYDDLSRKALALGQQVVGAPVDGDVVLIEGLGSFFGTPEFADMGRIKALSRALDEKNKLLAVLERTLESSEVRIFLGAETELTERTGTAVVAAPYAADSGVVGSIGIVGPTRMDYGRAIALVDYTARVVSRLLAEG